MRERQPADEHGVHKGEDGRVDADAEPSAVAATSVNQGSLTQHAGGEAEVLEDGHGIGVLYELGGCRGSAR